MSYYIILHNGILSRRQPGLHERRGRGGLTRGLGAPHPTVDFRKFIVLFGPRPWHIEIRHRVKKTSTINLSGFETLKLKIRRLKLWKPTVSQISQMNTANLRTNIMDFRGFD